jgi:hypothetical protein
MSKFSLQIRLKQILGATWRCEYASLFKLRFNMIVGDRPLSLLTNTFYYDNQKDENLRNFGV